ncbi:MAG TPA: NAD+ synthase, partial [Nitrospiria bacterium]|nr:NAD+ synthase [Nitrospiria bacterium]
TGYPPEDLLLKPQFIKDNIGLLNEIVATSEGISAVVGFVDKSDDIYNAAAFICDRKLAGVYHKSFLPNYGVFDEERYFRAGRDYPVFTLNGTRIGINICEDIWYPDGPLIVQTLAGAEVIVNINASPYHAGKWRFRERMLSTRAADNFVIVAYVNMVGGQDELVFDGHSMVFDQNGNLIARGRQFEEELILCDLNIDAVFRSRLHDPRRRKSGVNRNIDIGMVRPVFLSEHKVRTLVPIPERKIFPMEDLTEIYSALTLGVKDYVGKNGFSDVVIGMSGGIDSAFTAVIAVDALGRNNVTGVFMPSQYTSVESGEDASAVAKNLGIRLITLPIWDLFESYIKTLSDQFKGLENDVTEENLQARVRGNILMALSNKFGWLVLTTGNKSEMSVGYATLYGDMAGGFAVIKDVPKTLVYRLAEYRNNRGPKVIPERVFMRPPTAELKPGQTDQDTIPPYDVLDPILQAYVEEDRGIDEIVSMGWSRELVERVISMVDKSEYKRRQAPIGIKITPRALGRDRRMPVTNRYKSQ